MRTRSWIAIASLAICNVAGAQDSLPSRTLTRMIVGLGFPNGGVDRFTPTYTLGFELGPFNRRTSLRLMSEYVENTTARQSYYSHERVVGAQVLGVRSLAPRRLTPYFVAGAGLYSSRSDQFGVVPAFNGTPSSHYESHRNDVIPTLIWGVGMNIRLRATYLFSEVKLPFYVGREFRLGPQSPLLLGIKF